jgi:serine phosphatase RsbU (regulator of sigma subunit)
VCEAQLHFLKEEWLDAISKGKIAHHRADSLADIALMKSSAQILADSYEKQGDFKSALAYLKIAEHYEDSIYNEESSRLLSGLISTHELNKRDLEIKNLSYQKELEEKSNKLKDKQILSAKKESRMYFIGLISLLILIGLIAYFLFQIIRTNRKIMSQNLLIETQKEELSIKQTEIIDSINYAKRIQNAILPERRDLNRVLKSGFVFYLPKDIVSGDFYWMEELSASEVLIAVADCTGHGVPGAMVSVVCNNALNRSVREFGLTSPGKILDKTKEIVVEEFAKNSENVKDGMDISLIKLNLSSKAAQWAGANNPLWIHRKGSNQIDQIKPDKQPIGVYDKVDNFKNHDLSLNSGDRLYLFSDGFQDQFGGKNQKKYKPKLMRKFLLGLEGDSMNEIEPKLLKEFNDWKGDLDQLDDVCIVGIEL